MSNEHMLSETFAVSSDILEFYKGKKVLLTGGRGFIGASLAQSLAAINCRLFLLDRAGTHIIAGHPKAEIIRLNGDVSLRKTWDLALANDVDYVFHLAGQEYIRGPEYDPLSDLQANALPVLHLLEACKTLNNHPVIIFASSANVFGMADSLPVNEDQPDEPLIPWTIHKQMAEGYLRSYAHQYGIRSVILRLANVYGPTANSAAMKKVVVNGMIARAMAGESLTLYANHQCVRDYIFLADAVDAFLLAGKTDLTGAKSRMFVLGSGEKKSIAEAWQLIADKAAFFTNRNVEIKYDLTVKVGAFEMRNFVADTKRFQTATGWKPRVYLAQGIDLTIQAFHALQNK